MNLLGQRDLALGGNGREHEAVGLERPQHLRVGPHARGVRVDGGVADDVDPVVALLGLDQLGQARAVGLVVGGQRDPGAARLTHRQQVRSALNRVGRHDPQVRAGAGRRIVRLIRRAPGRARGQAHVHVRGAYLRDPGLIQDRHRDLAGGVVELSDVVHGQWIGRGLAGVRGRLVRIPSGGPEGRVVEPRVPDHERAGFPMRLRQRELDPVVHRDRRGCLGPAQREARVDLDDLLRGGGGRARGATAAAVVAGPATRAQRGHGEDRKASGQRLAESEPHSPSSVSVPSRPWPGAGGA